VLLGIAGTRGSVRVRAVVWEGGYIVVDRKVASDEGGQETRKEQALQRQASPLHRSCL
jgi:hypothetical protein